MPRELSFAPLADGRYAPCTRESGLLRSSSNKPFTSADMALSASSRVREGSRRIVGHPAAVAWTLSGGGWESIVRKTLEGAGALREAGSRGGCGGGRKASVQDASAAGASYLVLRLPALQTSLSLGLDISKKNTVLLLQYAPSGSPHPRVRGTSSCAGTSGGRWADGGGGRLGGSGVRIGSGVGMQGAGGGVVMMSRDEVGAMAWTRASLLRRVVLSARTGGTAVTAVTAVDDGDGARGSRVSGEQYGDQGRSKLVSSSWAGSWLSAARIWREGASCQMARVWPLRERMQALQGGVVHCDEGKLRELREEFLAIYAALREIHDISLLSPRAGSGMSGSARHGAALP